MKVLNTSTPYLHKHSFQYLKNYLRTKLTQEQGIILAIFLHSQYTLIVHALAIRIGQKWQRTHIHKTNSCTQLGEVACTYGAHSYIYIYI